MVAIHHSDITVVFSSTTVQNPYEKAKERYSGIALFLQIFA